MLNLKKGLSVLVAVSCIFSVSYSYAEEETEITAEFLSADETNPGKD